MNYTIRQAALPLHQTRDNGMAKREKLKLYDTVATLEEHSSNARTQ